MKFIIVFLTCLSVTVAILLGGQRDVSTRDPNVWASAQFAAQHLHMGNLLDVTRARYQVANGYMFYLTIVVSRPNDLWTYSCDVKVWDHSHLGTGRTMPNQRVRCSSVARPL